MLSTLLHLLKSSPTRILLFYTLMGLLLKPLDLFLSLLGGGNKMIKDAEPIFIVGLPRSGTTILYQYLCNSLFVTYTSNLWALFPKSGPKLANILRLKAPIENKSFYGNGPSLISAQEGGNIFSQWFKDNEYHYCAALNSTTQKEIQTYFSTCEESAKQTLLIKNVRNTVRIKALLKAFPKAKFISISREPMAIAQSVYQGRLDLFGNEDTNFTVTPKEWNTIKDWPLEKQIAGQVHFLEQNLKEDLSLIPNAQKIELTYNEFCDQPYKVVQDLINQFKNLKARPVSENWKNKRFAASSKMKINKDIYFAIEQEYLKLNHETA